MSNNSLTVTLETDVLDITIIYNMYFDLTRINRNCEFGD
jgi:hypothetical protein